MVFVLFIFLVVPSLFHKGMFLDGITYASIARNMAEGDGSFWQPIFSDTFFNPFYRHPPLGLWLQSLFFQVFGDHFWVERVYSLLTGFISGWMIHKIWVLVNPKGVTTKSWLPLLFWTLTPTVYWAYSNNVLENTMALFDLAAVYFLLRQQVKSRWQDGVIGAVFVILAFLTKGPTGVFPLAVPALYGIFGKHSIKTTIFSYWPLLLVIGMGIIGMYVHQPARQFLQQYFDGQVMSSISGKDMVTGHFFILERLVLELIPMVVIGFIVWLVTRKISISKEVWLFLAIGLSASLPIMISPKQMGHYLVPAMPYFALTVALLLGNGLATKMRGKKVPLPAYRLIILAVGLMGALGSWEAYRSEKRHEVLLSDVQHIAKVNPDLNYLQVSEEICDDWILIAYFQRYHQLSLDCKPGGRYYLRSIYEKGAVPEGFKSIELGLKKYRLFGKSTDSRQ